MLDYAREKLFDPLEIDSRPAYKNRGSLPTPPSFDTVGFGWATDAVGLRSGCCMLRLRATDTVKIGELYLGDGVWQGRRILPAGWVETSTTPSSVHPEYGLVWLRTTTINQTTAHTTYVARGFDGLLVDVVPDLRMHRRRRRRGSHRGILDPELGRIVPADRRNPPGPGHEVAAVTRTRGNYRHFAVVPDTSR